MGGLLLFIALILVIGIASWFVAPGFWSRAILWLGRRAANLSSKSIDVGGVRWHYLEGGSGPVLLLLHGFGADANCWLVLARLIRHQFKLVIPDLPGFGESERPDNLDFDIEKQADRLGAFLDGLGIDRCLLAGNSMGGYLGTALAAHDPARIAALWLLAPLGVRSVEPGSLLRAIDDGDLGVLQIDSVQQVRERIVPAMFSTRRWLPGPLIRYQANVAIAMREQMPRMLEQIRFQSEPLESMAKRVDQPVLIQWGADDEVVNPAGLGVLGRSFRHVTCALTERCGHLPMLERPRASARLFLKFFEDGRLTKPENG